MIYSKYVPIVQLGVVCLFAVVEITIGEGGVTAGLAARNVIEIS